MWAENWLKGSVQCCNQQPRDQLKAHIWWYTPEVSTWSVLFNPLMRWMMGKCSISKLRREYRTGRSGWCMSWWSCPLEGPQQAGEKGCQGTSAKGRVRPYTKLAMSQQCALAVKASSLLGSSRKKIASRSREWCFAFTGALMRHICSAVTVLCSPAWRRGYTG